ncbi:phosphate/phosphite/phosphonate ABC transporter substrate-binding protein [Colwellia sp. BRX8-7]|uniref:phosphate/phosphite/phosphonate ABC transporter substrate-binding protein n=1 Tax=Colwellia sp. BRX8-7 TaxID=2759833 RepID=UPI0015F55179|nr:PhnD/SsuA/transferrin family substrate-binding protein [Colwellia sp. BRX8-7]MBA6339271.1 phosphate/phosphite/phosphonate ABC transporter substrate-binding protein [Colwellia sp. BRX8-7]
MKKLLIIFIAYLLTACEQKTTDNTLQYSSTSPNDNGVIVYRLAIHPLHNPQKLFEAYQPLVDYLNSELQYIKIELEASRDYQTFEKKFRARQPELLLPNPWQTVQAMDSGYHVIGMAGDADDFKGIFIVRKDNDIIEPLQLEGKRVSYPAPTALAAAIMPQYFLYTHGIDINQHTENVYVGSQESSIMNVYLSNVTVGATWPPSWRSFKKDNPEQAKQLKVVWQTPSLINNSVMIRDDVPDKISKQIQSLLINLGDSEHGQVILTGMETARITSANDEDYDVVRTYIKNFEDKVRPVENK